MIFRRILHVILICGCLFPLGCSHSKKEVTRWGHSPGIEEASAEAGVSHHKARKKELSSLIEKKQYAKAIKIIRNDVEDDKENPFYVKEYTEAINGLIDEGKKKFRNEDYERSGKIFRSVNNCYPKSPSIRRNVTEKPEGINRYISINSEKIMEIGLSEYRSGNLGHAIQIWKKILRFNPEFIEARIAIDTATLQMKNLKSLKSKKK